MHRPEVEISRVLSQPPPSRGRHAAHPEPLPSASTPAELACARLAVDARGASGSSVNQVSLVNRAPWLRFQRCFVAESALAQATRLEALAGFHPLAPTRAQLTDFCNPYDSRTRPNESSEPRPPSRRSPVGAAFFGGWRLLSLSITRAERPPARFSEVRAECQRVAGQHSVFQERLARSRNFTPASSASTPLVARRCPAGVETPIERAPSGSWIDSPRAASNLAPRRARLVALPEVPSAVKQPRRDCDPTLLRPEGPRRGRVRTPYSTLTLDGP